MHPKVFYKKYIEQDFESNHVPYIFENICKQYLVEVNRRGIIEEPFEKIGSYYYDDPVTKTNGEFDIVTLDSNGYVFYEAKFKNKELDKGTIEKEIAQVNNCKLPCNRYGFFSKGGFTKDVQAMQGITLYELKDLFCADLLFGI